MNWTGADPGPAHRVGWERLLFTFWEFCAVPQGKIKKLVPDRGFGFIEGENGDLFFHHSEVKGSVFEQLGEGQAVEYEVGRGQKGPCATSVRVK